MGLTPDGGVSLLLPRAVGERRAAELLLTGAAVGAEEALRLGLPSRVVAPEALQAEAMATAQRLAAAPRAVLRRTKRLVREAADRSIADQLAAEREAITACVGEDDFAEGVRAFLERRKPAYPSASTTR